MVLLSNRGSIEDIKFSWKAPEGKNYLAITELAFNVVGGTLWTPDSDYDKPIEFELKIEPSVAEGAWLPKAVYDHLREYKKDYPVDVYLYIYWVDKDKNKHKTVAKHRVRFEWELYKRGSMSYEGVPGYEIGLKAKSVRSYDIFSWLEVNREDIKSIFKVRIERVELRGEIRFYANGKWLKTFDSGILKVGWVDPMQLFRAKAPTPPLNPDPEIVPTLRVENYAILAEDPEVGRLILDLDTNKLWFEDYEKLEVREAKIEDLKKLGFEDPELFMEKLKQGIVFLDAIKKKTKVDYDQATSFIHGVKEGYVVILGDNNLAYVPEASDDILKDFVKMLAETGISVVQEFWNYISESGLEGVLKTLTATGALAVIGKYVPAIMPVLFIGGMAPFICEEASQMSSMGIYIARLAKDPELIRRALETYERIVEIGKELTEKIGVLNPFTLGAYRAFFAVAKENIDIFRKLPEIIEKELEREREKELSWELYMKDQEQRSLIFAVNMGADALKNMYYCVREGMQTLDAIKKLEPKAEELGIKDKLDELKETIKNRLKHIFEIYDSIAGNTKGIAAGIEDPYLRRIAYDLIESVRWEIESLKERLSLEELREKVKKEEEVVEKPKEGYLYITTYPRYCKIYVDGEDIGKLTPELLKLSPGKHKIRLERYRRKPVEFEVEIKPGEKIEVYKYLPIAR